jgi:hypothetical protein
MEWALREAQACSESRTCVCFVGMSQLWASAVITPAYVVSLRPSGCPWVLWGSKGVSGCWDLVLTEVWDLVSAGSMLRNSQLSALASAPSCPRSGPMCPHGVTEFYGNPTQRPTSSAIPMVRASPAGWGEDAGWSLSFLFLPLGRGTESRDISPESYP